MAALTETSRKKDFGGIFLPAVNLRRTWKKWTLRSITLVVHAQRRHGRILDAGMILPTRLARVPKPAADCRQNNEANREPNHHPGGSSAQQSPFSHALGDQKSERGDTHN